MIRNIKGVLLIYNCRQLRMLNPKEIFKANFIAIADVRERAIYYYEDGWILVDDGGGTTIDDPLLEEHGPLLITL